MALACTTSPARTRLRSKHSYRCHVLQGVTDILDSVFTMASRLSALCIAQQMEKHTFGVISEIISSLRQCTISRPQIGFLYDLQIQPKLLPTLRHLNHSLYKDDSRSYTVAWAGDYGSTHPADSSVVTSGLAQELRDLACDIAVTHNLQSTEENLRLTWWTSHEAIAEKKMNDMIIIILSFSSWHSLEWKWLWFLCSKWITILSVDASYIQSLPTDERAWYRDTETVNPTWPKRT